MSNLTEIELASVDVRTPEMPLINNPSKLAEESQYVNTPYGRVFVTIQGNRSKPAFITYHDVGLNSVTQFHGFFNFCDMEPIMESFCAYHINAPGQEAECESFPQGFVYPTIDQLAETVNSVVDYFKLNDIICFGIGLGANVLSRFVLSHPNKANGLIVINCVSTKCGWIEWGYQKWNNWYLGSGQFTAFTQNYLLWHHFGYQTWETNHDLIQTYSNILTKRVHPYNLSLLISSYINRTDLGIQRQDIDDTNAGESKKVIKTFNFRCPVMNVIGDSSPHEDDVVETNGRLNPSNSSFVKFADCGGMVLEEQPAKMAESIRYFLQGLGYVPHLSISRHSLQARLSNQAVLQKQKSLGSSNTDIQQQQHISIDYSTIPDSFSGAHLRMSNGDSSINTANA